MDIIPKSVMSDKRKKYETWKFHHKNICGEDLTWEKFCEEIEVKLVGGGEAVRTKVMELIRIQSQKDFQEKYINPAIRKAGRELAEQIDKDIITKIVKEAEKKND